MDDISMISVGVDSNGEVSLDCGTCRSVWFDPPAGSMAVEAWVEEAIRHVREHHVTVIEAVPRCWCGRPVAEHHLFPCYRETVSCG